jgi:hypothetical protein
VTPMRQVMVRYRVKPDHVAENMELVRAVYDELHRERPNGLRYATFQLEDGVSFVHIAFDEGNGGPSPLTALPAFQRFQQNIVDRCDEQPTVSTLREIGSYQLGAAG